MIKVLVTGAGGQLGRSLKKVAAADNRLQLVYKSKEDLDITDIEALRKELEGGYHYCINTAAYTDVEGAEHHPKLAMEINGYGVRKLAEVCKSAGVFLVHISTDYIFDGKKVGPYLPADDPNPINAYGRSKLYGERAIQKVLEEYYIVRTSWLYSSVGENFYTTIINKAKAGEEFTVTDEQFGCPTHADHLALYLIDLVTSKRSSGIYHFTDGKPMTWYSFARLILEAEQLTSAINLLKKGNYRTFARRPKNSVLKNSTHEL